MSKALVTHGSRILQSGLCHRCKQSLIYTGVRGFASPTESGQDEFKFETLTGDYEGKIHWRISCLENIDIVGEPLSPHPPPLPVQ